MNRSFAVLGIINVLAAALGLLAFAYGESAMFLLLLVNLVAGYFLLRESSDTRT